MDTGRLRGALFTISFIEKKATNQSNQIYKALQAYGAYHNSITQFFQHVYDYLKRALLRWSVSLKATVSVEASIAIPIFLFAFLEILSLLRCLSVYSGVLYAIKTATDPVSMYAYAYDSIKGDKEVSIGEKVITSLIFSEAYLDSQVRKLCNTKLYEHSVRGGVEGINLLGTQINRESQYISAVARYETCPLISFSGMEIPMQNHYFIRMWTGYEAKMDEENAKEFVYITKTGEVYHTFRDCTHLTLSIRSISKENVTVLRNEYGERYTNCPMCMECSEKEERAENYYITLNGNKYHGTLSCSALKRTVYCVTMEEVGNRELCGRCGERGTE